MSQALIWWFGSGVVFGGFSAFIGREKNRNAISWFLLGLVFGLLAVLALIAVPKLEDSQKPSGETMAGGARESIEARSERSGSNLVAVLSTLVFYLLPVAVLLYFVL